MLDSTQGAGDAEVKETYCLTFFQRLPEGGNLSFQFPGNVYQALGCPRSPIQPSRAQGHSLCSPCRQHCQPYYILCGLSPPKNDDGHTVPPPSFFPLPSLIIQDLNLFYSVDYTVNTEKLTFCVCLLVKFKKVDQIFFGHNHNH